MEGGLIFQPWWQGLGGLLFVGVLVRLFLNLVEMNRESK